MTADDDNVDLTSVSKIRELFCIKISRFDNHASLDDVSETLDPILDIFLELQEIRQDTVLLEKNVVTPLIVACDKAQEACIEWILQKTREFPTLRNLLGGPLHHAGCGNSTLHYAANSNCVQAIPLLCEMMRDETETVTTLLSQRNDNFDTIVMYAAIKGHVDFLREILRLFLENDDNTLRDATKLFELVNDDGETALNLACGYGHTNVVSMFVDEANVTITYDIVKEAEQRIARTAIAILTGRVADEPVRRKNVKKCLVILQVSLEKSTQASMEELLAEAEEEQSKQKPKGKAKKKKKKQRRKAKSCTTCSNTMDTQHQKSEEDTMEKENTMDVRREAEAEPLSACRSEDLEKATIDTEQGDSHSEGDTAEDQGSMIGESETKDEAEEMSTDRKEDLEQAEVVETEAPVETAATTAPPSMPRRHDFGVELDVDAIIDALCLDTSMLLLNQHDMAVDLSPCQLDAVAAILRNQLQAVKEARTIQLRLRNEANQL